MLLEQYLLNINSLSEKDAEKCLMLMTEERRKYLASVSNEKRRLQSIAGEWLVKTSVSRLLCVNLEEVIIERDEKGKPFVKERNIHISISHSGDFVAAAIDTKPVGIDIEVIKPVDLKVLKRVCSESDSLLLLSEDSEERLINFLKIWTAKEAYFKMKGTGIVNLKAVSYKDINAVHTIKDGLIITTVNHNH